MIFLLIKKITVENPNAVSTPEKEKIIAAIKEKNNRNNIQMQHTERY